MGYPMTYNRVISRNSLTGNYTGALRDELRMICGDLRRLEQDAMQPGRWRQELARRAGVDEETLVRVLTAFWDGPLPTKAPHDGCEGHSHVNGMCQL